MAAFRAFRQRINDGVLTHEIIRHNPYTAWFAKQTVTRDQARDFLVQFSVFSNEFLVAQLRKMNNAESLAAMRASKEILANEIGVTFRDPHSKSSASDSTGLGDLTGSVNGGTFRFRAAHFELLVRMAEHIGLSFSEMGKRRFGTPSTLFFCDELIRLYGSEDYLIATAASFAVENWAAAGFWDELVRGWKLFKQRECETMPLTFFSWHAQIEANHAQHTMDELEEFYFTRAGIDENQFIASANEMLDGVQTFWVGLAQRIDGDLPA